ncbi:hypothetical protein OU798_10170 [Prolixibacteraceae bacterium Z1-6]|uniref:Uncharacterized protein n=1 Tax=Draconibacterium aestuarii TaxID=2998507 RepID=A0A9X3FD11_9BACT|nr:hypothetical protein [Prolixibacteraceae bacterium Z1-6]
MKFNLEKFNEIYHVVGFWVFSLGIMIYLFSFNSLQDSITYNKIDLLQPSQLRINRLENVGERKKFPLLLLEGQISGTRQHYRYRISRGEFEELSSGDTILVYETHDRTAIISQYSITNSKPFVKLFGYSLSIYVLGEAILFLGMFVVFVFSGKWIYKVARGN